MFNKLEIEVGGSQINCNVFVVVQVKVKEGLSYDMEKEIEGMEVGDVLEVEFEVFVIYRFLE